MTKREERVINAFINCVKSGEFSEDYAITLIEDNQKYGWISEEAKEVFYEALEEPGPEPEEEEAYSGYIQPEEEVEEPESETTFASSDPELEPGEYVTYESE